MERMNGGYMWGYSTRLISKAEAARKYRAARKHGATFIQILDGNGNPASWYAGDNYGEPFNSQLKRRVQIEEEMR